jgi:hypothetical protein
LLLVCSSRGKEKKESGRRSAADYERLRKEAEERRRKRFADVFVRIHVTNRHTKEVLHIETVCLSDPVVVQELFCSKVGGHHITGGLEYDPEAYRDYKVTLFLIDLGGDGLRVAELVCLEKLELDSVDKDAGFARLYCYPDSGCYGFGSEWEAASITVNCDLIAYRLEHEHDEDEEDDEEDPMWGLFMAVEFTQLTDQSGGWGIGPYKLEDVSAVYEFLDPFINTRLLLKWH